MSRLRNAVLRGPKGAEILDVTDRTLAKRRTRRRVDQLVDAQNPLWVEIGSGRKFGSDGWVTLDIELECDLYWDLRHGLPFPDASVSRIYSSHLFEHLTYNEGQALMRECLRALIPGGEFSICVPNARYYLDAYARKEHLVEPFMGWTPAVQGTSLIDMVNYVAYLDGHHKCMFDEESLIARMQDVGMTNVSLRGFDPAINSPGRDFESVYALGYRPEQAQ